MAFEKLREDWSTMDPKFKWVIGAMTLVFVIFFIVKQMQPEKAIDGAQQTQTGPQARNASIQVNDRVLPQTSRNQGVEEILTRLGAIEQDNAVLKLALKESQLRAPTGATGAGVGVGAAGGAGASPGVSVSASSPTPTGAASSSAAAALDAVIPNSIPPVDFSQPGGKVGGKSGAARTQLGGTGLDSPIGTNPGSSLEQAVPEAPQLKIWPADVSALDKASTSDFGGPVIPVNSALESVMLSGINARPSGSIGGSVGSVNSANNVGAPFVTRIKGDAILPNGWKLADLGDCFLGGSGIAILSTERAYVIADTLSCIAPNGEVYEAPIRAYGLDVDGTLGIAGKVVSKQGALLLQAALTGMASGLGAALTPSTIPAYNSNATSGSTASVQFPNPAAVAQTTVGQGLNQAASQLSKFYLDYAKEIFPVVEVVANTRVTWVLKESVELKRQSKKLAIK